MDMVQDLGMALPNQIVGFSMGKAWINPFLWRTLQCDLIGPLGYFEKITLNTLSGYFGQLKKF